MERKKASFPIRYVIVIVTGLSLLAGQLILTLNDIQGSLDYANLINKAGRQRRFSQTIALQAVLYAKEEDERRKALHLNDLEVAIEQAKIQYEEILGDTFGQQRIQVSEQVYEVYYGRTVNIDAEFSAYINAAEAVTQTDPQNITEDSPDLQYILENNQSLLALQNEAVTAYENSEKDFNNTALWYQVGILIAGSAATIGFWFGVVSPLFREVKKEAEESKKSRKQLQTFISQIFGAFYIFDKDGTILQASENIREIFNYSQDEVVGKNFMEFFPEERIANVQVEFKKLLDGGELKEYPTVIIDGNQEEHQIIVNAKKVEVDGENQILAIVGDAEKEARERKIREDIELKYNTLIDQSDLIVFDESLDDGKIEWAGALLEMIGYSSGEIGEITSQQKLDLIHPDDKENVIKNLKKVKRQVGKYTVNYRFKHKNGKYRYILEQGVSIGEKNGISKRIIAVMIDLSEIREATAQLEKSQKQFKEAFQTSPIGFALVSLRGEWLEVNSALTNIVGYPEEELMQITFQEITHPDDLEKDLEFVQELIDGKKDNYQMEKRYFHKDGHVVWILLSVSIVRDDKNLPQYFVSQIQDITQQKEFTKQTQELNEVKNTFIRTVSHQLRTPLSSINWNLETLLSGDLGKINKEQEEFIRLTAKANKNISQTIQDLLVVIDIEEGRVNLDKEEVRVETVINSAIAELKKEAELKMIQMEVDDLNKSLPPISADPQKISDALKHIFRNAINYTEDEGRITVELEDNSKAVTIKITDTGIGIPKNEQERIFEKFYRGSNASSMMPDASGVGLTIAQSYIKKHGGEISVESKQGKGSTFTIVLPIEL